MPVFDADFKKEVGQKVTDVLDYGKSSAINSYNATKSFTSSLQWKDILVACGLSTAITALIVKVYDDKKIDPIAKAVSDGSTERKEIRDLLTEVKEGYNNLRKQLVDKELIAKKDEITNAMQSDYTLRRNRAMYKNSLLSNSGLVTRPFSDIMPSAQVRFNDKPKNENIDAVGNASAGLSVVYKQE